MRMRVELEPKMAHILGTELNLCELASGSRHVWSTSYTTGRATLEEMCDRQLSKRSKRRLRSKVAVMVAAAAREPQPPPSPVTTPISSDSNGSLSPEVGVEGGVEMESDCELGCESSSVSGACAVDSDYADILSAPEGDCESLGVLIDSETDLPSATEEHVSDCESLVVLTDSETDLPSGMEEHVSDYDSLGVLTDSDVSISEGVESDDEQEESSPIHHAVPLYPQAHVSSEDFDVAFMTFVQRHNLNYACQRDLLKLFSIILPSPSSVSSSSYMLTNNFFKYEEDVVTQHYCGSCMSLLRQSLSCTNPHCNQKGLQRAVFVRLSLTKQLEERFEGKLYTVCITYLLIVYII